MKSLSLEIEAGEVASCVTRLGFSRPNERASNLLDQAKPQCRFLWPRLCWPCPFSPVSCSFSFSTSPGLSTSSV